MFCQHEENEVEEITWRFLFKCWNIFQHERKIPYLQAAV